jgi:ATP-dependent Clp protease, protease subunit
VLKHIHIPSLRVKFGVAFCVQLVPAVTELVISELLWLNYSFPDKPVYVYINSIGSQTPDGQAVGFETEAYAIIDTLAYIKPEIHTLVVGQAYGNAAMILASGKKGCRFSLPNARIMTAPPRMNRSFGSTSSMMIKANELEYVTQCYTDFLAKFTGRDAETVRKDIGRNRYFTPSEAIDYGLIDRIVRPEDALAIEEKDYEGMLQAAQARSRGSARAPAGASAET